MSKFLSIGATVSSVELSKRGFFGSGATLVIVKPRQNLNTKSKLLECRSASERIKKSFAVADLTNLEQSHKQKRILRTTTPKHHKTFRINRK